MNIPKITLATLATLAITGLFGPMQAAEFHVAPAGSDANAGTERKPFATLEKARDAIRAVRPARPGTNTIVLHGGEYFLARPVVFTPADSGTPGAPLVIAAAPGEKPVLTSARAITGWRLAEASTEWEGAEQAG